MTGGIFGGGVIFVVAAVLWTAVLVPSWIRRREFREAERHAIRLQRTLRVLAETAEVPNEVRAVATAKEALAHEKLLRTAQRQQEAERAAELAAAEAERVRAEIHAEHMKRKQATVTRAQKLRRPVVRRIRSSGALVALIAVLGMLVGTGTAIAGQGPAVLLTSAAFFAAASGVLVLLAPGRVRVHPIAQVATETPAPLIEQAPAHAPAREVRRVDDSAAAHAAAQAEARARIDRARALARARATVAAAPRNQPDSILLQSATAVAPQAQRAESAPAAANSAATSPVQRSAAQTAAQTQAQAAEQAAAATAERFRAMGVVGDTSTGMLDLDAVLRSRRNAG